MEADGDSRERAYLRGHRQVEGPLLEGQQISFLVPRSLGEHPKADLQNTGFHCSTPPIKYN